MDGWFRWLETITDEERVALLETVQGVNLGSLEGFVILQFEILMMVLRGHLPVEVAMVARSMIQDLQTTMMALYQKHGIEAAFSSTTTTMAMSMKQTLQEVQPHYYVAHETIPELPEDAFVIDAEEVPVEAVDGAD
jgi:hypothetical protein